MSYPESTAMTLSLGLDLPFGLGECPATDTRSEDRAATADDPYVARAQKGDARAFQQLYRLHRGAVVRIVTRMLLARGLRSAIDDVTQDVFLQVFRALPNFRGDSRFSTWLHSIAVHVVMMYLRSLTCRPKLTVEPPCECIAPDADSPIEGVLRRERLRALDRVLGKLSDKKRMVYVLHDLEGMSASEIATVTDTSVLTVRTRLFYARREVYAAMARDPSLAPVVQGSGVLQNMAADR